MTCIPNDALISGSDGCAPKPDPGSLRAIAEELGVPVGGCIVVGDDAADIGAAHNAPTRYAHDLPIELAVELGVLGLLLGLMLYASTIWSVLRARHTPALWLLAPLALAFLASNLLDWTWHLVGLGALWAAATGTLHGAVERES